MIGFIIRIISTIIIYLISNIGTIYLFERLFNYHPTGLIYLVFYIFIGLIALTIEKIIYSGRDSHLIPILMIIGLSIIFY